MKVRLMSPFNMQCNSCSHFIYKNTKFNARKDSLKQDYLGIPIFKFTLRCSSCGSEIVFRTDPKSRGYVIITGANTELNSKTSEKSLDNSDFDSDSDSDSDKRQASTSYYDKISEPIDEAVKDEADSTKEPIDKMQQKKEDLESSELSNGKIKYYSGVKKTLPKLKLRTRTNHQKPE